MNTNVEYFQVFSRGREAGVLREPRHGRVRVPARSGGGERGVAPHLERHRSVASSWHGRKHEKRFVSLIPDCAMFQPARRWRPPAPTSATG